MFCPNCNSDNVKVESVQENLGSTEFSRTDTKEKKHGCLWWLLVGWELWILNILSWIFLFIPRVLLHIGRRKKYVSKTTTQMVNHIVYKTVCTCQNCGNTWTIDD